MPLFDYFAKDGKTRPWYGVFIYPPAFYVSGTDKTWIVWESFFGGDRIIRVATYDHTAGTWATDVTVASHSLANDDHGVPAICRDADGYVHCFGGSHDSNMFEWVTNAADNPAAWTLRTTFSNDIAYPRPVLVGSTMYLFVRDRDIGSPARSLALYTTTGIAAGVPTWGSIQELVDFGSNSRVYTSNPIVDGTDIHLVATFADYSDNIRLHHYYFVYDTTDGSIRNADNSVSVASGSLPISLATANASFRFVTTAAGHETDTPGHCLDDSGDPHVVFMDHTIAGGTTLQHVTFTGGSWSAPSTVHTFTDSALRRLWLCLMGLADGSLELWYDDDPVETWPVSGGDMMRRIRSSGGVWGSAATILAASSYALGTPSVVRDGHDDARIIFAEITGSDSDAIGGNLKCYLYGDAGFVQREFAGTGPIPPADAPDPHWASVKLLLQGRP